MIMWIKGVKYALELPFSTTGMFINGNVNKIVAVLLHEARPVDFPALSK